MKTKVISLAIIAIFVFGFFFFGSGGSNGFNAHFSGYRTTHIYQSSNNLFSAGFNGYYSNSYSHSLTNYRPSSSSLSYRFGFWAI